MRRAKSLVATGEIELMSTTVLPGERPSATPPLPNSTCSTSGVSGTIVITTSARSAISRPERHAVPPASTRSAGAPRRLCRNSSCPPLMRCPAMGRPMMPRPMKPTFMAILLAYACGLCAQIRCGPAKTGRCCGFRLVFAADPSGVAFVVESFKQEGIVDLACPGLMSSRVVGELNVGDRVLQLAERREELAVHPLLMVEIVLEKGVRRADLVEHRNRFVHAIETEAWKILRINGLHQKPNANLGELPCGKAQVLNEHAPDTVGVDAFRREADEAAQLRAAQRRCIIDGPADAVLELADAVGQARDPALSAAPIASGQVVEHLNEVVPVERLCDRLLGMVIRKHKLDAFEAVGARGGEAVEKAMLGIEHG